MEDRMTTDLTAQELLDEVTRLRRIAATRGGTATADWERFATAGAVIQAILDERRSPMALPADARWMSAADRAEEERVIPQGHLDRADKASR
jgi:hypothetical protein